MNVISLDSMLFQRHTYMNMMDLLKLFTFFN